MKTYHMPHCLGDLGMDSSEETFEKFYERRCHCGRVDPSKPEECKKLREVMEYFWQLATQT